MLLSSIVEILTRRLLGTQLIMEQGRIKSRARPDQLVVWIRESKAKEERREREVALQEKCF